MRSEASLSRAGFVTPADLTAGRDVLLLLLDFTFFLVIVDGAPRVLPRERTVEPLRNLLLSIYD